MRKFITVVVTAFFVVACVLPYEPIALSVSSNVTRFHSGIEGVVGKTYIFQPFDSQKGSLLFEQVTNYIDEHLLQLGLKKLDSGKGKADLLITLSYGIDGGQTVVSSSPVYGSTGGGTTLSSGTVFSSSGYGSYSGTSYQTPNYGIVGSSVNSRVVYRREFNLDIVDIRDADNPAKLFEGQVISTGSSSSFVRVRKCLIQAMFENFPGVNGSTERVSSKADCMS